MDCSYLSRRARRATIWRRQGDVGARIVASLIVLFARFITAVRGRWENVEPVDERRIYFANHASHGDFILIWAVLPPRLRQRTRPVAGADYWLKGALRRFIGRDVFNAVLIDRDRENRTTDRSEERRVGEEGGTVRGERQEQKRQR